MGWISGTWRGIVGLISALALLLFALTAAKVFGTLDWVEIRLGSQPTPVEQEEQQYEQEQKECVALFVWHTTKKSNQWKSASEEAEWLSFIAFWNTVRTGRPPCSVFQDAEVMVPDRTSDYQWSVFPFYTHDWVRGEAKRDLNAYKALLEKFGPLLGLSDLKPKVPESLQRYMCVRKLVRSNGERFTTRLRMSLDDLAKAIERKGYHLVKEIPAGIPNAEPYRFYCPN